jgi:hypothetical protein
VSNSLKAACTSVKRGSVDRLPPAAIAAGSRSSAINRPAGSQRGKNRPAVAAATEGAST